MHYLLYRKEFSGKNNYRYLSVLFCRKIIAQFYIQTYLNWCNVLILTASCSKLMEPRKRCSFYHSWFFLVVGLGFQCSFLLRLGLCKTYRRHLSCIRDIVKEFKYVCNETLSRFVINRKPNLFFLNSVIPTWAVLLSS